MPTPFAKYSGCGNDFILVDNRSALLEPEPAAVRRICDRKNGIGADGLLLVERSSIATVKMRIFNADGTEAEMCGNGVRCIAHFAASLVCSGQTAPRFNLSIEAMHQKIHAAIENGTIVTVAPPPKETIAMKVVPVGELSLTTYFIDTGVPHAILFKGQIDETAFPSIAPRIRHHNVFAPKGTNVNFVELLPDRSVRLRTYERGVEGETLACGTGAMAAALAAASLHGLESPVTVRPASGETLTVAFDGPAAAPIGLSLTGPAVKVYEGVFSGENFGFCPR